MSDPKKFKQERIEKLFKNIQKSKQETTELLPKRDDKPIELKSILQQVKKIEERTKPGYKSEEKIKQEEYENKFNNIKKIIYSNTKEFKEYLNEVKNEPEIKDIIKKHKKIDKYLLNRYNDTGDIEYLELYNKALIDVIDKLSIIRRRKYEKIYEKKEQSTLFNIIDKYDIKLENIKDKKRKRIEYEFPKQKTGIKPKKIITKLRKTKETEKIQIEETEEMEITSFDTITKNEPSGEKKVYKFIADTANWTKVPDNCNITKDGWYDLTYTSSNQLKNLSIPKLFSSIWTKIDETNKFIHISNDCNFGWILEEYINENSGKYYYIYKQLLSIQVISGLINEFYVNEEWYFRTFRKDTNVIGYLNYQIFNLNLMYDEFESNKRSPYLNFTFNNDQKINYNSLPFINDKFPYKLIIVNNKYFTDGKSFAYQLPNEKYAFGWNKINDNTLIPLNLNGEQLIEWKFNTTNNVLTHFNVQQQYKLEADINGYLLHEIDLIRTMSNIKGLPLEIIDKYKIISDLSKECELVNDYNSIPNSLSFNDNKPNCIYIPPPENSCWENNKCYFNLELKLYPLAWLRSYPNDDKTKQPKYYPQEIKTITDNEGRIINKFRSINKVYVKFTLHPDVILLRLNNKYYMYSLNGYYLNTTLVYKYYAEFNEIPSFAFSISPSEFIFNIKDWFKNEDNTYSPGLGKDYYLYDIKIKLDQNKLILTNARGTYVYSINKIEKDLWKATYYNKRLAFENDEFPLEFYSPPQPHFLKVKENYWYYDPNTCWLYNEKYNYYIPPKIIDKECNFTDLSNWEFISYLVHNSSEKIYLIGVLFNNKTNKLSIYQSIKEKGKGNKFSLADKNFNDQLFVDQIHSPDQIKILENSWEINKNVYIPKIRFKENIIPTNWIIYKLSNNLLLMYNKITYEYIEYLKIDKIYQKDINYIYWDLSNKYAPPKYLSSSIIHNKYLAHLSIEINKVDDVNYIYLFSELDNDSYQWIFNTLTGSLVVNDKIYYYTFMKDISTWILTSELMRLPYIEKSILDKEKIFMKGITDKTISLFDILNQASNNYQKILKIINKRIENEPNLDANEIINNESEKWLNSNQGKLFKFNINAFGRAQDKLFKNYAKCLKEINKKYKNIDEGLKDILKKIELEVNIDEKQKLIKILNEIKECKNNERGKNSAIMYYDMILNDYPTKMINVNPITSKQIISNNNSELCRNIQNYYQIVVQKKFTFPMWTYNNKLGMKPVEKIINIFKNVNFKNNENKILILKSGTGTGKSVTVPPLLVESGLSRRVVCTQPRKMNATNISQFVSCLMGAEYGKTVGYKHSEGEIKGKKLIYMTDGMLVQELLHNITKFVKNNSFIVIDEVHERSIDIDILLAIIKKILSNNYLNNNPHKLQVVIMSATIDPQQYIDYFTSNDVIDKNRVISFDVEGQNYPVTCIKPNILPIKNIYDYTTSLIIDGIINNAEHYWEEKENVKDILVFLESVSSIRKLQKYLLESKLNTVDYPILILTGQSSDYEKNLTMDNPNSKNIIDKFKNYKRRIILATNVAETGLTFEYLKHVIDLGWMNTLVFNPMSNSSGLLRSHETVNNAMQRRGRVGRTGTGYYYPLFKFCDVPEELNKDIKNLNTNLEKEQQPSIYYNSLLTSLLNIINILHEFGDLFGRKEGELINIYDFDFMDQPPIPILHRNLSELYLLGAINNNLELTKIGKLMGKMNRLSPYFAKAIIAAEIYHCTYEIAIISACCSIQGSFYNFNAVPNNYTFNDFTDHQYQSDHINMLITFMKYSSVRKNNSLQKTNKWCIINRLNADVLNNAYNAVKQILTSIMDAGIPILSYNININDYSNEMKVNIIKALFTGLFLNTARVSSNNIKYLKIYNWYSKDYYSEVYKGSSFYTGNFRIKNLYPKDVFFGSIMMKDKNGMYTNYITGGISPYDPKWIGNLVPKLN